MSAPGAGPIPLGEFATEVTSKFQANAPGQPEDQLRGPLERLLKAAGGTIAKTVVAKGESLLPGRLGKPDYAVLVDGALTGYVELKAPGHGANPNTFKGHDRDQWRRFRSLPNPRGRGQRLSPASTPLAASARDGLAGSP